MLGVIGIALACRQMSANEEDVAPDVYVAVDRLANDVGLDEPRLKDVERTKGLFLFRCVANGHHDLLAGRPPIAGSIVPIGLGVRCPVLA
ncbi:hypothetical protein, partial [Aureimonas sp. AU4]|uniref:hypothetical protein n=1 Tax=Aureimonas sp. AU4 TaxID=1638163 RepID=UPI001AEC1C96